jgi:ATP-binding cassette subfamily B protein RaxB
MDEATSQLDVTRESEINRALSALRITRVVVAHRPEMIAAADRVIAMAGGVIIRDLRQHQIMPDLLSVDPLNVA